MRNREPTKRAALDGGRCFVEAIVRLTKGLLMRTAASRPSRHSSWTASMGRIVSAWTWCRSRRMSAVGWILLQKSKIEQP